MSVKLLSIVLLFLLCGVPNYSDALLRNPDVEIVRKVLSDVTLPNIAQFVRDNDIKISNPECLEDLQDTLLFEPWVIRMVDASGKMPHGILRGGLASIGQYKQCIETSFEKPSGRMLTGKHCMLQFIFTLSLPVDESVPNYSRLLMDFPVKNVDLLPSSIIRNDDNTVNVTLPISVGICFQSSCSASDFNEILSQLMGSVHVVEETCSVERKTIELSPGNIFTISFLSLIGFIMLCSSLYDIWFQLYLKGDLNDQNKYFTAFSVYTNSQKLFTPSANPGPLAAMHGIRVISIFWVILGHRYVMEALGAMENILDYIDWTRIPSSNILLAGTVAVDTFFLMSGFLLSYVFFKSAKLQNIWRELPMFYIHRILRLTPLLAVLILIHATLLELYGNGPYNHWMQTMLVEPCVEAWWTTLLYVQNYVSEYVCIGQSWYLAVDMQLYIISPLLLYPLLWNKKIGIVWLSLCIATAQTVAFSLAYVNEFSAGLLNDTVEEADEYQRKYYIPTHTRATPYFIGILAGYLVFNSFKKNNVKTMEYKFLDESTIKKCLIVCGWLVSLTLMGLVLFGLHPFNQADHEFSHAEDTLYLAFHRTAWSLGVLWVIVACAYGYGGPINWFLSLQMFEVLGRFSYALYLTHMSIQVMLVTNRNHVVIFDHFLYIYNFFGDLITCMAISYVLIMAFESPIVVLEKLIFKKEKRKEPSVPLPEKLPDIQVMETKIIDKV